MDVSVDADILTLKATEDWTLSVLDKLHQEVQHALETNQMTETVVLDFSNIDMVDSSGIKVLLGLYKTCLTHNISLQIQARPSNALETLRLCGIEKLADVQEINN